MRIAHHRRTATIVLTLLLAGCGGGGGGNTVPGLVSAAVGGGAGPGAGGSTGGGAPAGPAAVTPSTASAPSATPPAAIAPPPAAVPVNAPIAKHVMTFAQVDRWNGSWSAIAPYLTMANVQDVTKFNSIAASGIKTVWYQDPHRICDVVAVCSDRPAANELSTSAFMQCSGGGRIDTSYNNSTGTYFGDPTSPELVARTNAHTQQIIAAGHLDYVWFDDTVLLEDQYAATWNCGAGNWRFGSGAPYSAAAFASAMGAFHGTALRPVMMEGVCDGDGTTSPLGSGNPADPAGITQIASAANTVGAICESFGEGWQSSQNGKVTSPGWQSRENTALQVQSYNKLFIAWPYYGHFSGDPVDQRGYHFASFMMIFDPNLSVMKSNGWGIGPASGVDVQPESLLVPGSPLKTASWSGAKIDGLKNGGLYVREFAACSYAGTPVGPCAAVVNPDQANTYPLPALAQTYRHAAKLSGFGILTGANGTPNAGDNGSFSLTGSLPAQIGPQGWAILLP